MSTPPARTVTFEVGPKSDVEHIHTVTVTEVEDLADTTPSLSRANCTFSPVGHSDQEMSLTVCAAGGTGTIGDTMRTFLRAKQDLIGSELCYTCSVLQKSDTHGWLMKPLSERFSPNTNKGVESLDENDREYLCKCSDANHRLTRQQGGFRINDHVSLYADVFTYRRRDGDTGTVLALSDVRRADGPEILASILWKMHYALSPGECFLDELQKSPLVYRSEKSSAKRGSRVANLSAAAEASEASSVITKLGRRKVAKCQKKACLSIKCEPDDLLTSDEKIMEASRLEKSVDIEYGGF